MSTPPEPATLASVQARFAAALRARDDADPAVADFATCVAGDGLEPASRVRLYRNNSLAMFEGALGRTYAVVRRRVGDDFFRGLGRQYREAHPSRSGDLHWVGSHFPDWLANRFAGSEYAWLADLARLEWACEESLVSGRRAPLDPAVLARVPPEELAEVRLELQPALRVVASDYPVWSVWRENPPDAPGAPVDLSLGAQHVVVTCGEDGLVLHSLPADRYRCIEALQAGATLVDAVEASGLDVEQFPAVLAWLFGEGQVAGLSGPGNDCTQESP